MYVTKLYSFDLTASLAPGGGLQPTIEQEKAPRKSMKDVVAEINDKVKSGQESITDNEPSTAKPIKATAAPKKRGHRQRRRTRRSAPQVAWQHSLSLPARQARQDQLIINAAAFI